MLEWDAVFRDWYWNLPWFPLPPEILQPLLLLAAC
jgi:hypothetical protein